MGREPGSPMSKTYVPILSVIYPTLAFFFFYFIQSEDKKEALEVM